MGNGITNCYPDEVGKFISITVLSRADVECALAQAMVGYLPGSIRDSLCQDEVFAQRFRVRGGYVVSFGEEKASFRLDDLAARAERVLGGAREGRLRDAEGRRWALRSVEGEEGLPGLVMVRGQRRMGVPREVLCVSAKRSVRLAALESMGSAARWVAVGGMGWRELLSKRPLVGGELGALLEDLGDTPGRRGGAIREELREGGLSVRTLVPASRRYFERLVGAHQGSSDIREYGAREGALHLRSFGGWGPSEGLMACLYSAGDAGLAQRIEVDGLEEAELGSVLGQVEERGDSLAVVGGLEVGFRALGRCEGLGGHLVRLMRRVREEEEVEAAESCMGVFAALFHVVEAELSRSRLFGGEPAYYRRLAAAAHAAVVQREVGAMLGGEAFREWAWSRSIRQCEMQAYVDGRGTPRWDWRYGLPEQVRAWFIRAYCGGGAPVWGGAW